MSRVFSFAGLLPLSIPAFAQGGQRGVRGLALVLALGAASCGCAGTNKQGSANFRAAKRLPSAGSQVPSTDPFLAAEPRVQPAHHEAPIAPQ